MRFSLALVLLSVACAANTPAVNVAAEEAVVRERALAWGAATSRPCGPA